MNQLLTSIKLAVSDNCRVAVACSGGLDSISLLHATHEAGFKPIVLHIDHGIHPDSTLWKDHVCAQATLLGLESYVQRVSGLSADMPNLENAARQARHSQLNELCSRLNISVLLLAHHANDQAETVLLNLFRGTGLAGIGMPKHRQVNATTWVKPWLDEPQSQIASYAAQHQLQWVQDPSNQDTALRRNAIRHELWPIIQAIEPRALSSLLRFSSIAHETANTVHELSLLRLMPFFQDGVQLLDWKNASKNQSQVVQLALLRAWLHTLGCKPPTQAHAQAMVEQLGAQNAAGLRCTHDGWRFYSENKLIKAQK